MTASATSIPGRRCFALPDTPLHKELVRLRFARSLDTYGRAASVQAAMAGSLVQALLAQGPREFPRVLEAGCGTGGLTDLLERSLRYQELLLVDLVPECERFHLHRPRARFLAGDLESLPLPGDLDLCVANAVFQWLEHPREFLRRLEGAMRPGALLAFTAFGPQNLQEVTALTGRGLAYPTGEEWEGRLRQEGFSPLFRREWLRTLLFPSPREVLRHLKETGVTATGKGEAPWSRRRLQEFQEEYRRRFAQGGEAVPLTYHPLLFVARKPG